MGKEILKATRKKIHHLYKENRLTRAIIGTEDIGVIESNNYNLRM